MKRRSFLWSGFGSLSSGFAVSAGKLVAALPDSAVRPHSIQAESQDVARLSSFETTNFDFYKLADGIYSAVTRPNSPAGCNAAIVVNEEGVLVVDAHLRPSAAREIIQGIARITKLPVRYVVNSHFHNDHTQGNQAYIGVFPKGVEYLSHHNTRRDIVEKAIPRLRDEIKHMPEQIRELNHQFEMATDERQKATLKSKIQNTTTYLDELKQINITLPTATFDSSLYLHGSRLIEMHYFGRGHTAGDVVLFLPTERVLISGDLFLGPHIPYSADAYPSEWAATLRKVAALDFDQVAIGHTAVTRGKEARLQMQTLISFMEDVVAQVRPLVAAGKTLDQVKMALDLRRYEGQFANWATHSGTFIERAYAEVTGSLK
jgi:glyoxylase-like metal-dependent hydrolase (beta-lactamase superfamily II)